MILDFLMWAQFAPITHTKWQEPKSLIIGIKFPEVGEELGSKPKSVT
jgi:hypothetical protein